MTLNPSNSNIDKSPLLKPSEFWGPKKDRPLFVPTGLFRSPKDERTAIHWWQPTTNDQDLYFLTKTREFRHSREINQFFQGKLSLADFNDIINKDNARQFLNELKVIELYQKQKQKGSKEMPRSTKELRELCALKSERTITSAEAFLKTTDPRFCESYDNIGYLAVSNPDNLIPERVAELARVTCNHAIKMLSLSRKMGQKGLPTPSTLLLRGNMGVGKSRTVEGIVSKDDSVYSPDSFKFDLRRNSNLVNQLIHKEGAANYGKVIRELQILGTNCNFIYDETLRDTNYLSEIQESIVASGGSIVFREIDAPLMLSSLRILGRDIRTEPCIPFDAVANSFATFRKGRKDHLKQVVLNHNINDFQLIVRGTIAAEKTQEKVPVLEIKDQALFDEATTFDPKEVDVARKTVITEALLKQYEPMGGVKVDLLSRYIGKTVEQALNERAAEIPTKASKS